MTPFVYVSSDIHDININELNFIDDFGGLVVSNGLRGAGFDSQDVLLVALFF